MTLAAASTTAPRVAINASAPHLPPPSDYERSRSRQHRNNTPPSTKVGMPRQEEENGENRESNINNNERERDAKRRDFGHGRDRCERDQERDAIAGRLKSERSSTGML